MEQVRTTHRPYRADLTPIGEEAARHLGPFLRSTTFDLVASAHDSARATPQSWPVLTSTRSIHELVEWDYGDYEGRTRIDIQAERPDWSIWTHGAPGGESAGGGRGTGRPGGGPVPQRRRTDPADRARALPPVVAARWIDQPITVAAHLPLDTATVCVLGYDRGTPTLDRWNAAP